MRHGIKEGDKKKDGEKERGASYSWEQGGRGRSVGGFQGGEGRGHNVFELF